MMESENENCESEECCGQESCYGSCCTSRTDCCDGHDPAVMAKMVYHKAMLEMVKDRVKKKLEETHGKKADRLAELVFEGMEGCKEAKDMMKKKCEWERKVMEAMHE